MATAPPPQKRKERKPARERRRKAAPGTSTGFLRSNTQVQLLIGMLAAFGLFYIVVSYFYPIPFFYSDSGSYILSARQKLFNGVRPIGYSWFLSFFRSLSPSYYFIGAIQYLLYTASATFFVLAVTHLFPPRRPAFAYALGALVILSPIALLLTRWVMSDSVFISLTLVWLATGLLMLEKPRVWVIVVHLLAMYLAMEVRHVGLCYPIASALAGVWAWRKRSIAFVVACAVVGGGVYLHGIHQNKSVYGFDVFSGFTGWSKANNAVAVIPYVDLKTEQIEDENLRFIHQVVASHPDSNYAFRSIQAVDFIWKKEEAGKQVLTAALMNQRVSYTQGWIGVSMLMGQYGDLLVSRYPLAYLRHFLLPNAAQIFYPTTQIDPYTPKAPDPIIQDWYEDPRVDRFEARYDVYTEIFRPFSAPANAVLWAAVFGALIALLVKRRSIHLTRTQGNMLVFLALFVLGYIGLSVLAHPVVLRYLAVLRPALLAFIYCGVQLYVSRPAHEMKPAAAAVGAV